MLDRPVIGAVLLLFAGLNCLAENATDYGHSLDDTWAFKTDLYSRGEAEAWFSPDLDTGGCSWRHALRDAAAQR